MPGFRRPNDETQVPFSRLLRFAPRPVFPGRLFGIIRNGCACADGKPIRTTDVDAIIIAFSHAGSVSCTVVLTGSDTCGQANADRAGKTFAHTLARAHREAKTNALTLARADCEAKTNTLTLACADRLCR